MKSRDLAKKIAAEIFTDGTTKEKATRLVMERDGVTHQTGWGELSLASFIERMLKDAQRKEKKMQNA